MKPCNCPRCSFFGAAALDLLAMGDVEGANLASAEITWTHDDGSIAIVPMSQLGSWEAYDAQWRGVTTKVTPLGEGYSDEWSPEVFN